MPSCLAIACNFNSIEVLPASKGMHTHVYLQHTDTKFKNKSKTFKRVSPSQECSLVEGLLGLQTSRDQAQAPHLDNEMFISLMMRQENTMPWKHSAQLSAAGLTLKSCLL